MQHIDAQKIKKDIADLEDKKQILLYSLQNDIDAIETVKQAEFCKIGLTAYTLAAQGEDFVAALTEEFKKIDSLNADQDAKRNKMSGVTERYDDEISMMERLLPKEEVPAEVAPAPTEAAGAEAASAACSGCGKPYKPGVDKFCMSCGNKL